MAAACEATGERAVKGREDIEQDLDMQITLFQQHASTSKVEHKIHQAPISIFILLAFWNSSLP